MYNSRHLGLDIARFISAIAVVLIHTAGPYASSETIYLENSTLWWTTALVDSLSRFAVPMFVILTGVGFAAASTSKSPFHRFHRKTLRLLGLIFLSTVLFVTIRILRGDFGGGFASQLIGSFKSVLAGKPYFHLWYLYMAVGLVLFGSTISLWLSKLEIRNVKTILILSCAATLLYSLQNFYYNNKFLFIFWFIEYIFYFFLGFYWFLYPNTKPVKRHILVLVFLSSSILMTVLYFVLFKYFGPLRGQYFYDYVSPLVLLQTVSLFLIFVTVQGPSTITFTALSGSSAFVYILHPIITEHLISGAGLSITSPVFFKIAFLSIMLSYAIGLVIFAFSRLSAKFKKQR